MFIDTLIIGNGFAGRTVANVLMGESLIVERGEKFNIFERRQRFLEMDKTNRHDALIRRSYESKHAFNVPEQMPKDCASEYILVDGGCSNHWGGLSFRLSENMFASQAGDFPWPFSYQAIQPYYSRAESLLRISADPKDPEGRNPRAAIKGVEKWHQAMGPYFPAAYIGAQAHNLSSDTSEGQGQCLGAGDCELCPMDAKTRSLHVRSNTRVLNGVMVDRLRFEGGKAVEAICITEQGPLTIGFNRVIIAAQVVIPELSGEVDGIEFTTLALMTPPNEVAVAAALDVERINAWDLEGVIKDMSSVLSLYVLLEIPPEWDISLSYSDGKVSMDTVGYHKNKVRYNGVIDSIYRKMETLGVKPLRSAEQKHYMNAFGTHHLVGMLSMGEGPRAVVGSDFKLKGTENVSIAGSALFPRCGSRNPTVTVVATSLILAEKLNAERGESVITQAF